MSQLSNDGLCQDPDLFFVLDDQNDSHGPCPTRYADAPTERRGDGSRKTVPRPVDMVDIGGARRAPARAWRVPSLRLPAVAFVRFAEALVAIASNAAQHAGRARKNPAKAGFKSKGGNAHD
jgi:hypothetical protein